MRAQDLRIGNLVHYNGSHKEIGIVTSIQNKGLPAFQQHTIYLWIGLNERIDILYELDKIKPIPLSEKWLLDLGFKEGSVNILENDKYQILISYYDGWHFIYVEKEGFGSSEVYLYPADIYYIHKLQNLIHALTGEELTLKPQ